MTDPCDPSLAPLRCWEHTDCRGHPELALSGDKEGADEMPVLQIELTV